MLMTQTLMANLLRPGVVTVGLLGMALQLILGVANNLNIAGLGDLITSYGLGAQLTSGGLIAALTGMIYSVTERTTTHAVATGAGATAGGISGTLGTGLSQTFGIIPLAPGATPIIDFAVLGTLIASLVGMADPSAAAAGATTVAAPPAIETTALAQVFATTAAGGGIGAWLGRFVMGQQAKRRSRRSHSHRTRHAH